MMDGMKKMMTVVAISVCIVLLACGNKEKQTVVIDGLPTAEESQSDTVAISVQIESSKEEENPSTYDNMRGFDPASEDDMDDNGMSRYMENNDEEGWD